MEGIIRGKKNEPLKAVVYADAGKGKSTLGESFPNPFFLDLEGSTDRLDVDRVDLRKGTFASVMEWLNVLAREEHGYQTLVVDTLDWLEPLIWASTSKRLEVKNIEVPGFHKGYREASLEEWPRFLNGCSILSEKKKMHILLLAHAETKKMNDPMIGDYDRWDIKLHKWAVPRCVEWAELVGFLITESMVRRLGTKEQVTQGDERMLIVNGGGHFVAKNRFNYKERAIKGTKDKPLNYELIAKELGI